MEYKNVDEVINKLMLSYSSLVRLISRAMENDKGEMVDSHIYRKG